NCSLNLRDCESAQTAIMSKNVSNPLVMVGLDGQLHVAVKIINQKNAAVLVERLCDPDGERNSQRDVNNVSPNDWSHDSFLSWFVVSVKKAASFISKI